MNQIALCHLDSEENVAKMLPVNQQTGTFSGRDLEKLGFGIILTRCRDLHLKQFCLDDIVPAVLIILITHIIISVRWILIKNLSVVINHYLHGM